MQIEKVSSSDVYGITIDDYQIAIQYHNESNVNYCEWNILSIQDKKGEEVDLPFRKEFNLKQKIIQKISELEE